MSRGFQKMERQCELVRDTAAFCLSQTKWLDVVSPCPLAPKSALNGQRSRLDAPCVDMLPSVTKGLTFLVYLPGFREVAKQ